MSHDPLVGRNQRGAKPRLLAERLNQKSANFNLKRMASTSNFFILYYKFLFKAKLNRLGRINDTFSII